MSESADEDLTRYARSVGRRLTFCYIVFFVFLIGGAVAWSILRAWGHGYWFLPLYLVGGVGGLCCLTGPIRLGRCCPVCGARLVAEYWPGARNPEGGAENSEWVVHCPQCEVSSAAAFQLDSADDSLEG